MQELPKELGEKRSPRSLVEHRTQISKDIQVTQIFPGRAVSEITARNMETTTVARPLGTRGDVRSGKERLTLNGKVWQWSPSKGKATYLAVQDFHLGCHLWSSAGYAEADISTGR